MAAATEIGGDVVAAGAAIAGLMLVYMGGLSASYSTYETAAKRTVRASFQRRAWFAFVGLVLNSLAIPFGLTAKALDSMCALLVSLGLLLIGVAWLVTVAVFSALEIN